MIDYDLYVQTKLNELAGRRLREKCSLLMDLQERRQKRGTALQLLLAPRLMALGAWLEQIGTAMSAGPQTQD